MKRRVEFPERDLVDHPREVCETVRPFFLHHPPRCLAGDILPWIAKPDSKSYCTIDVAKPVYLSSTGECVTEPRRFKKWDQAYSAEPERFAQLASIIKNRYFDQRMVWACRKTQLDGFLATGGARIGRQVRVRQYELFLSNAKGSRLYHNFRNHAGRLLTVQVRITKPGVTRTYVEAWWFGFHWDPGAPPLVMAYKEAIPVSVLNIIDRGTFMPLDDPSKHEFRRAGTAWRKLSSWPRPYLSS